MVTPRSLGKGMAPTERLNCLIAMEDREEEIKDLGKWVYHVRPKASQKIHYLPRSLAMWWWESHIYYH